MNIRGYRLGRAVCLAVCGLVVSISVGVATASAHNVLMGLDSMVGLHPGTFRGGANTFEFNATANNTAEFTGVGGALDSFVFSEIVANNGGNLNFNARTRSDTPESWNGSAYSEVINQDLDSDFLPLIDRVAFGHVFDPNQYEIEVKLKPVLAGHPLYDATGGAIVNQAVSFAVGIEQMDGFVLDAQTGLHKRAGEQFIYGFGGFDDPNTGVRSINTMYLDPSTPKDAGGFMTLRRRLNQLGFVQKGFYYDFGNGTFRDQQVVPGGGRMQDPNGVWVDVVDGLDTLAFSGPLQDFSTPQGVPGVSVASSFAANEVALAVWIDFKSILIKKINPDPTLVARLDAQSGITGRFGTSLNYGTTVLPPPINVNGVNYQPPATTEMSRFNSSGMTNLFIDAHAAADPNNSGYQFFLRMPPEGHTFDGTDAVVNLRARLTQPIAGNVADSLRVILKDLDKNDGDLVTDQGAEEYFFDFDLTQLNTSTMTTLSIPLASFSRDPLADNFTVQGDNDITDFNLYELTGLVLNGGGLLKLELEFIEVRLPSECGLGDFNCDTVVDGRDFLEWQRNPAVGNLADWEANYGAGLQAATAVPEPSALLLSGLAACGLTMCGRRRGRR